MQRSGKRNTLRILAAALAAATLAPARAGRPPRLGYLTLAPLGEKPSPERLAFLSALRDFGYVEGKNIEIVYRSGEMNLNLLQFEAQELVDSKVDIIAAAGTVPAIAAKNATRSIPIVMIFSSEPVIAGLVTGLARPGGNVTGVSTIQTEIDPKRLALLKSVRPGIGRVAVLWTRFHPSHKAEVRQVTDAARKLGLSLDSYDVTSDLIGTLKHMDAHLPDAIFVLWDVRTLGARQYIIDFALKHKLPTSMPLESYVVSGGLMSYGPNVEAIFQRSAWYVHRILGGAKPADLPVERPSKLDLVINLRTANKLDLTLPPPILLLADRVIE